MSNRVDVFHCLVHEDQSCRLKDHPERNPHALYCDDPTLTKQSFKDECDINHIVKRAVQDPVTFAEERAARVGQYGDFTSIPSYQAALDLVNRARGMFMSLDANIRERFANDPRRMVEFLQNPQNRDEAVRLGLVNPPNPPVEAPVEAGSGPKAKASKGKASAEDEA